MRRRTVIAILAVAVAVLASWGIVRAVEERRFRALLAEARREIDAGQFAAAHRHLDDLLARRPGCDEALYHLGVCEQARHRAQAARDCFDRVAPDSEWAGWSAVRSSRIAMDGGHFAECEELLLVALARPGSHAAEARWGLVLLLRMEGRFDEARRCLQAGFDRMTSPLATLRRLYRIDIDPFPIEGVRSGLERAARQAPEDDRVWLARAHLSIRTGDFDEAGRWLERCLRRRPEDPAVWRMKLEWGLASDRPDAVREALKHLPAADASEDRVLALRAWLAARRGDRDAEIGALAEKVAIDPGDGPSRERLAALHREAGRIKDAEALRAALPEIERTRKAYIRLLASPDAESHSMELADLAERLGRSFDAARWRRLGGADVAVPTPRDPADVGNPSQGPSLAEAVAAPEPGPGRTSTPVAAPSRVPRFVDDAGAVGLAFVQESGGAGGRLIPPVTASGGVGLIDVDGDGWLDVYLVQGGPFPPEPKATRNRDRLFRNRGDGTFVDASAASGIAGLRGGYGHGVAVADYDNDGHPDLFITRWRSYALYRNRGDGTFEDATARAGLAGDRDWPTSAAFADLDNDGDLDLYVCHYMTWDEGDERVCSDPSDPSVYHCLPLDFPALPDHLFRNDGGRFVDITAEAGIVDADGRGLGVVAADLDDDGRVDLYVANDMTANFFFRNLGGLRFEEVGLSAGLAGNATGAYQAGMGVACGDFDGDGRPDLAVTNFYNESTTLFRNLGGGIFADQTAAVGLAGPSRYVLGFGAAFLDADNDGWLDLMTANGHVHDGRPQFPWKMPVQLFLNEGGRRFADVTRRAGEPFEVLRMGRGLAAGDLDNDGRVDALIVGQDEPSAFFHNRSDAGHWLALRLEGTASNRDAVGAVATVHAGGRARVARRLGGGSYQSAGDPRLHFGLGASTRAERVDVRWPSGRLDRFDNLDADAGYALREGDPTPRPLPMRPPGPPREGFHAETQRSAETQRREEFGVSRRDAAEK